MKRIHLFEFEDFSWFPNWLRKCMTRYIEAFHKVLNSEKHITELVLKALKHSPSPTILDLCSGSGGPMINVTHKLIKEHHLTEVQLKLSDLYPNLDAASKINNSGNSSISYITQPIDATKIDKSLQGVRTMICSLHHMKPQVARNILKEARDTNQPICIYEISDNAAPIFLWWLAIPFAFLMTFLFTPLVRPMTIKQIVFTYLIPIIPLFVAWDGAVSNARVYTLDDLDEILKGLHDEKYTWEKGIIKGKGGGKIYLLGLPKLG